MMSEESAEKARGYNSTTNKNIIMKLENFSAKWEEDKEPVLKNVSLTLKKGEMIGIFGPVGSGKVLITLN